MTNKDEFAFGHIIFENGKFAGGTGGGLTKREYFAAMAMQGAMANTALIQSAAYVQDRDGDAPPTLIAAVAVASADALIEALNKEAK